MAERLAVDATISKATGLLGARWDDKWPCSGRRITKVEFNKKVQGTLLGPGSGDATLADTELPDLTVHCWADMHTRVSYTLKVWVED